MKKDMRNQDQDLDQEMEQDQSPEMDADSDNDQLEADMGAAQEQDDQYADENDPQDQPEDMPEDTEAAPEDMQPEGDTLFIAGDADNAGQLVGQAVLDDDVEQLHAVSNAINAGQDQAAQWVESVGGEMISAGGDEFTAMIPAEAAHQLEELRSMYSQAAQATLSIGVGQHLSQAGKALIYAKLNGKDQIAEYDEGMEDFLDQVHAHVASGDGNEDEQKMDDHYISHYEDRHDDDHDQVADDAFSDDHQELDADNFADDSASFHTDDPAIDKDEEDEADPAQGADLQDMVAQDAPVDGDPEQMGDHPADMDSGSPLGLKDKMLAVVEAFKEEKDAIEQSQQSDPELYQQLMTTLQQLIKLARMMPNKDQAQTQPQDPAQAQQAAPAAPVGKPQP